QTLAAPATCAKGRWANGEIVAQAPDRSALRGEGILPRGISRPQRADRGRPRRRGSGRAAQVACRGGDGGGPGRGARGRGVAARRGALRAATPGRPRARAAEGLARASEEAPCSPAAEAVAAAPRSGRRARFAPACVRPAERALAAAQGERTLRPRGGRLQYL